MLDVGGILKDMKLRTALRCVVLLPAAVAGLAWWVAKPRNPPVSPDGQTLPSAATAVGETLDHQPDPPDTPSLVEPTSELPAVSEATPLPAGPLPIESPVTGAPAGSLPAGPSPAAPTPAGESAVVSVPTAEAPAAPQIQAVDPSPAQGADDPRDVPGLLGVEWNLAEVKALTPQLSKRAVRLADALAAAGPLPVPVSRLALELSVTREAIAAHAAALNRTAAATRPNLTAPVQQHGTPAKPRYTLDAAFAAHWPPEQS